MTSNFFSKKSACADKFEKIKQKNSIFNKKICFMVQRYKNASKRAKINLFIFRVRAFSTKLKKRQSKK
jgi:hypothetical protein